MKNPLNRRHFLRSSTALIALPFLESLGFRRFASAAGSGAGAQPPKRLVFLGFGWGVTQDSWYPKMEQQGCDYTLPAGLEPLARHRADFSVVQGVLNKYNSNGHYGSTFWLTGANEFGQAGQSFHNRFTPTQLFLFAVNGFSDFQVKRQQLVVDRSQRLVLALADRCRERRKELRIFWRRDFHRQKGTSHTEFLSAKSHEAGTEKNFDKQDKAIKFWFLCRTFLSLKSPLANYPIAE
jgi:hypothetical protein